MTKAPVIIIDYGLGNLLSVQRAFTHCGVTTEISSEPSDLQAAPGVILPGVGAFADGMQGLNARGFVSALSRYVSSNRPLLGICLGMQMLFDSAEEFGHHQGLGIIPGAVKKIDATGSDGKPHKIPHIGWNGLRKPADLLSMSWQGTLLEDISEGSCAYFVHSYTAFPYLESARLADAQYNGRRIAAVVRKGNVYGCQFHPEKSGQVGLSIIRAFGQLCLSTEEAELDSLGDSSRIGAKDQNT